MQFRSLLTLLAFAAFCATQDFALAGSATWNLNPPTQLWLSASNWTPNTIPNGPADVATFGVSNFSSISGMGSSLSGIVYNAGASSYTTTVGLGDHAIGGAGITNNAGTQKFTVLEGQGEGTVSKISFTNSASAGINTQFTLNGSDKLDFAAGEVDFFNTSSAGSGVFFLNPPVVSVGVGGAVGFFDSATAGNGTFFNSGFVLFNQATTAGSGYFETEGSTAPGIAAGLVGFLGNGSTATFVNNAGTVAGAPGGAMSIFGSLVSAGDATLIANTGVGDGGAIVFAAVASETSGGTAQVQLNGKGLLDISDTGNSAAIAIGSLSGDGQVFLGAHTLKIGNKNTDTSFDGTMQDGGNSATTGGGIEKIGTGTLALGGASLYTGLTTVSGGMLVVENRTGSATGRGAVQVNAGTLGGFGTIAGAVTIGTGSGLRTSLAPAGGTKSPATLTVRHPLTFASNGLYAAIFKIGVTRTEADKVVADGVTINSGAIFSLRGIGQGTLSAGTTLNVIKNTAATPIAGTFANLADGAILTVNGTNFQASYEGGDGNDLTLTVVP